MNWPAVAGTSRPVVMVTFANYVILHVGIDKTM